MAIHSGRRQQEAEIDGGTVPQPLQKRWPPILVGGMTKGALQRVVRRADGWIALGKSPADLKQPLETLREMAVKAGRKPAELHISMLPISAPSLDQVIEDLPRYAGNGRPASVSINARVDH